MRPHLSNTKGFTIVELMVAAAIAALIMGAASSLLHTVMRSYQESVTRTRGTQEARTLLLIISEELRYAQSINVAEDGKSVTYTTPDITFGEIYVGEGVNDKTLIIKHDTDIVLQLAHGLVGDLTFTRKSVTTPKPHFEYSVSVTIQQTSNGENVNTTMDTLVVPINTLGL